MFAVIYIPDFSLQSALRFKPEWHTRPVALIDDRQSKTTVFQLTAAARAAGVHEGMTPTQAMARCAAVIIQNRSLAQESAACETLLQCAYSFSPRLENTGPGLCTLDLQGLPLAGTASDASLEKWGQQLIDCLARLHLQAQVGLAENPNLALHAARCARPFLAVQNSTAFLAALPIESIEPSAEILSILTKWGIRSLGEFTSLSKERIAQRLEPECIDLFERASGQTIRPLNLVTPPETFEETIDFEHPVETLEPLLLILRRFVDQISRRLELAGFVAEELHLRMRLTSGQQYERLFKVPAPTGKVAVLVRMLHTHLENVRTDSPIIAVYLMAKPARPDHQQFGLFESTLRDPNQFCETVARLTGLLEPQRVGMPVVEPTHRPDAFRLEPPNSAALALNHPRTRPSAFAKATADQFTRSMERVADSPQRLERAATGSYEPRGLDGLPGLALRRFRPPRCVQVLVLNDRPTLFRSGDVINPLRDARGPWRISGHWWDDQTWNRDEWEVETIHGEIYRLFVQDHDWFLDGIFD